MKRVNRDIDPDVVGGFYLRWVLANGLAEALGLGSTFALGTWVAPRLAETTDAVTVVVGALAAVVLGTVLEGVVVGLLQEGVLRRELVDLRPRTWTTATALGAGLAWIVGMVPSTVMALSSDGSAGPAPVEPSAVVQYGLAVLLGLATGPILGGAQWLVLRRHVPRAARWLLANALAWAVAMPVIFVGMDLVPWSGPPLARSLAVYAVCGASGMAAGAVHGRILLRLLSERDAY